MFRRELDLPPLEDNKRPMKSASEERSTRVEKANRSL
jgi:hypothetical protein